MKRGFTLIELIITIVMLAALVGVTAFVFRAVLLSWSSQETRSGIDISLDRGIEEIVRDLREARQVNDNYDGDGTKNDEIRFTQDQSNYYIYYFYNANDAYPPTFNQSSYDLRKATLSGGIGGTLTDSGRIIITDVLSPSHATSPSDLSFSSNIATIDLSITRRDETIRSRSQVKPRNL